MKQLTAKDIKKAVKEQLSYFPWGGRVLAIRQNQWREWIVECKIPGHYNRVCDGQGGHFYHIDDKDCPIRQFMVDYQIHTNLETGLSVRLWVAKDDKRLPSFMEEVGRTIDKNAPPSPYIVEPIKAYIEAHKNDSIFF